MQPRFRTNRPKRHWCSTCNAIGRQYVVRLGHVGLLTLSLLLGSLRASAQPTPDSDGAQDSDSSEIEMGLAAALDRAQSYYQAGQYDSCADSYRDVLGSLEKSKEDVSADAIEGARVRYAACLLALGRRAEADAQLRAAMTANPLMASPDPVIFPEQVRDLFFQVKNDFLEDIRKAQEAEYQAAQRAERERQELIRKERLRVQQLERLASQEVVVHQNRRWIAALPFGVGQFQNRAKALGVVFLGTEVALLGITVTAVSRQLALHSQADGGKNVGPDPAVFNNPIQTAHSIEIWSGAGFLLLASLGILEAQVNFVDELEVGPRKRKVPPAVASSVTTRVLPSISPTNSGAVVGVSGRF